MLSKFGSVVVFASPTGRPRYGNTSSRGAGAVKSKANVLAELVETQDTGVIDLTTPCGVHSTIHTCMNPFKDNPGVVQNWRALWRSLPAYLRQEALLTNAAKDVNTKALMALGNGLVKYSFLGRPVCRNAFMTLTGIGAWSLTDARKKLKAAINLAYHGMSVVTTFWSKTPASPKNIWMPAIGSCTMQTHMQRKAQFRWNRIFLLVARPSITLLICITARPATCLMLHCRCFWPRGAANAHGWW